MHSLDEVKKLQGEIASASHGEAVYEDIQQAIKGADEKGRWFWELLQNAMDAVDDGQTVSVCLIVEEERVTFSHNGSPFTLEEILKLITQGSSKKDAAGKAGRFGTGFISTYLLSRQVEIAGVLDDGMHFSFLLDRMAGSVQEFIEKQNAGVEQFVGSFLPAGNNRQTSFTYLLEERGKIHAEQGLRRIDEIIPFVLAFNHKIERIEIDYRGQVGSYTKEKENQDGLVCEVVISLNEGEHRCSVVRMIGGSNWQAGYKILYVDGQRLFAELPLDFPNLFKFFPLLGTDALGLPLVIHSSLFDVKRERDGVFLGTGSEPSVIRNKQIVEKAVRSIPTILQWAVRGSIGRIHNAIPFRTTGGAAWLESQWIEGLKREGLTAVETTSILWTLGTREKALSLREAYIPYHNSVELRATLYDIGKCLFADKLPGEGEADAWYTFCLRYAEVLKTDKQPPSFFFSFTSLCQEIQNIASFDLLAEKLGELKAAPDWLKQVYEGIMLSGERALFDHFAIVPTRAGSFAKVVPALRTDGVGDDGLLAIAYSLIPNLAGMLVPANILLPTGLCEPLGMTDLLGRLITQLMNLAAPGYAEKQLRLSNARLLKWLIEHKDLERIKSFPVLISSKDKTQVVFTKINLSGYLEKIQKLLAPVSVWQEEFSHFAALVRDKDCLDAVYAEILTVEDFIYLEEAGLLYSKPMMRYKGIPGQGILEHLVKEPDQLPLLLNGEGNATIASVEYTDFAFLGSSDDQILKSVSFNRSALILTFALLEAVERDAAFDSFYEVTGAGGVKVALRNSLWVGRLRNNQWVNVRNPEVPTSSSSAYVAEQPSSHNLAALIRQKADLKSLTRAPKAAKLLKLWGVSLSDLMRNILPDEALKEAWDQTFTTLLSSSLQPEQASEMLTDDNLLKEYQKKKDRTEQIRKNQGIGAKMEGAFRDLFTRPEYEGLTIERKPFGSDFILIPDSDLANDVGQEELFAIGPWLIELKATTRPYAAMTELQGQTAVDNRNHYALAVLPLDGSEITEESIITKARFVTDIGHTLTGKYEEVVRMQQQQGILRAGDDQIEVALEGEQLRYHIREKVWKDDGVSLAKFLDKLMGRNQ